ncbi:MAG TPA: hypothetical protein PLN21_00690 [Gemmatales bacterium]|nr:hypothetical protein [Gemmatales bacterium]
MLRATLALLASVTLLAMTVWADDKNKDKPQAVSKMLVTYVMADVPKNTLTFKITDKAGKKIEIKLPLDKDAKVLNKDDKSESFADFAKSMERRLDKSIYIIEDKEHLHITQIKDIDTF